MTVASKSYDAQLQIRRDAEERTIAHQDLGSWMEEIKSKKLRPKQYYTSKPVPPKDRKETFVGRRLQGNKCFAQGKYEDAIQCYTRCLGEKDALASPLVYSNRAMAHLKLKSWAQAEEDATSALQIDPLHFKSYQRRCVARLSMGKVRAAMLDVCAAEDSCALSMKEEHDGDKSTTKSSLAEIQKLRIKVEKALVAAANRAPRRKLPITIINQ